jgi:hypothetical protein
LAQRQQSWFSHPNSCYRLLFDTYYFTILYTHKKKTRRVREHHQKDANGNLGVGEIRREIVVIGEGAESFETDFSADLSVGWSSSPNYN